MKPTRISVLVFVLLLSASVPAHAWVSTPVDSVGAVGLYTSIALDSPDHVHISYSDHTMGKLKYANTACVDNDGDGYGDQSDCDDHNPQLNPDIIELPLRDANGSDAVDNDCEGRACAPFLFLNEDKERGGPSEFWR